MSPILLILLIGVGVFIVIAIVLRVIGIKLSFPWIQFMLKGRDAGFKVHEITNLYKAVVKARLHNPTSIFWSKQAILKCIVLVYKDLGTKESIESFNNARFIRKLYDLMNRILTISQNKKIGVRNSRDIPNGTNVKITAGGREYSTQIVENNYKYMAIGRPPQEVGDTDFVNTMAKGKFKVNFWKKDDSGYAFTSTLIGDFAKDGFSVVHIQHSRNITRTSTRALPRKKVNLQGELSAFLDVNEMLAGHKTSTPLRCQIVDISEKGLSAVVGGHPTRFRFFAIQLMYDNTPLEYLTRLRAITSNEDRSMSLLHLEAINTPVVMRNRLASIIYDVYPQIHKNQQKPVGVSDDVDQTASGTEENNGATANQTVG